MKFRVVGAMGILMTPHRSHLYQLLANEMGIDHWKVSVGYGVLQAVVGIGALALRGYGTLTISLFLGFWCVGEVSRPGTIFRTYGVNKDAKAQRMTESNPQITEINADLITVRDKNVNRFIKNIRMHLGLSADSIRWGLTPVRSN